MRPELDRAETGGGPTEGGGERPRDTTCSQREETKAAVLKPNHQVALVYSGAVVRGPGFCCFYLLLLQLPVRL